MDPIGYEAWDANRYRYVGNDPVNGLDPSGLEGQSPDFNWTMGLWSLEQPKFWSGKPSWEYTAKMTLKWDFCGDKLTYSKS